MEEGMAILREWKKFLLHVGALYHHHTLEGELEEAMQLVVPMAHKVVAMNGCHRDAGTSRPMANTVSIARLVLVAWHDNADAEGDQ